MGSIRAFGSHVRWSDQEVGVLSQHYATANHEHLTELLPGRNLRTIQCKANALGLVRHQAPRRSPEDVRRAKRDGMARLRERDPAEARRKRNAFYTRNRERQTAKMREYAARRFFWARANRLDGITASDLASLWKAQKGRCGLSGRRLDRLAEIDHKLPKARCGTDAITNLRWVCKEANRAKRDLTDEEFVALCSDCMSWIGQRIDLFERVLAEPAQ